MKKVLTLMMVVGLLVAFSSVTMAMGICGGPKATQAQANAEPANTQQSDQLVVAQAEMTEDTSPVEGTDEETTEDENSSN